MFCEKLMGASVEECRLMTDTAHEKNRILGVNFNTRSGPVYNRIKQIIDEGSIGKVRVVRIAYN